MAIDWWTFGLQTVNVLILIWILSRFFWRPVAAMIERRRVQAQALLDDAQAARDAAAKSLAEAEKRSAGFAKERESILQQARGEAAEARRALMALDLLTGAVQAYIFAILAMVFIGGAVGDADPASPTSEKRIEP